MNDIKPSSLENQNVSILNSIFNSAVEGMIIINDCGKIQKVNPAACTLFQYKEEELMGENVAILMSPEIGEKHDNYIHNYLKNRIPSIIGIGREVIGVKKDKTSFPFWLSVNEIIIDEKIYFTGFIHDLTQVKVVENKLLQLNDELETKVTERTYRLEDVVNRLLATNSKLSEEIQSRKAVQEKLKNREEELKNALTKEKELGELKSRFVSMTSHEFRTPLATILSSVNLIQKYETTEQQEKRDKHINKIKSTVGHLVSILNDFLSMNKLEEGIIKVCVEEFDLMELIQETVEEMRTIKKPKQMIIIEPENFTILMNNDQRVLKNILINLITNSIKYSKETGHIFCRVKDSGEDQCIEIEDNGIGIPPEDQVYLFERFFRAANAMNIEGTGLGLHIVKKYLEMIRGKIDFESVPHVRTVFKVYIPKDLNSDKISK